MDELLNCCGGGLAGRKYTVEVGSSYPLAFSSSSTSRLSFNINLTLISSACFSPSSFIFFSRYVATPPSTATLDCASSAKSVAIDELLSGLTPIWCVAYTV
jgi:hypothetical protein